MMCPRRLAATTFLSLAIGFSAPLHAEVAEPLLIIHHVRIFDGRHPTLSPDSAVVISGNHILSIKPETGSAVADDPATRSINGGGRVLLPGLIDAHVHLSIVVGVPQLRDYDPGYLFARAGVEARATLMRGFTTVRDMAGPTFGLKQAIDEGLMEGPRIFPSGAMISQTSGHADFRQRIDTPQRRWSGRIEGLERLGYGLVADGVDEVTAGVREQLRLGATQIKLAAGGGVSSVYDPIDSVQYSDAELRAAVQAASDFGTYVAVHAYTPTAIRRAIDAGVRSIEHAQLIDEPTLKEAVARGVYLSPQAFLFAADSPVTPLQTVSQRAKAKVVAEGLDQMMQLAQKYHAKVAFGTDLVGAPQIFAGESREFGARLRWFSSAEILSQATAINGDLLALSGSRNLYGRLGVVEVGALADLLIVDGNPLEDIRVLESPESTLRVIVKDGRVVKQTL